MIDALYILLARFGFNEPLHSPITHMPIGLAAGALIFLLVALLFKNKAMVLSARHASILAFIFVFPTILLGVFDWVHFYHATFYTPIKIKMGLASCALLFLGAGIILGSEIKLHSVTMTMLYALTFIVMTGLGYFGAGIIYGRGLEMKKPVQAGAVSVHGDANATKAASAATSSGDSLHLVVRDSTKSASTTMTLPGGNR